MAEEVGPEIMAVMAARLEAQVMSNLIEPV